MSDSTRRWSLLRHLILKHLYLTRTLGSSILMRPYKIKFFKSCLYLDSFRIRSDKSLCSVICIILSRKLSLNGKWYLCLCCIFVILEPLIKELRWILLAALLYLTFLSCYAWIVYFFSSKIFAFYFSKSLRPRTKVSKALYWAYCKTKSFMVRYD